jgi:hypothetical protein
MVAASVLYAGILDTTAIITAVGTNAFSTLVFLVGADGKGIVILKQGS